MDVIFSQFISGLGMIFTPAPLMMLSFGVILGVIFGALPGLTAILGISVLMPITFFINPVSGITFLLGIYCGGIYGGSIPAILLNTPGAPASAATLIDGFPLASKGHALKTLQMALYASVIAGLISCATLILVSKPLASIALRFGPPEFFALAIFGLTVVALVSGESLVKGVIAASLGIMLSFVGCDPMVGLPRLTFGVVELQSGMGLLPITIGLFAISEVMRQSEITWRPTEILKLAGKNLSLRELKENMISILRGSFIGTFIGAIPGTGAAISAFVSYNEAKRTSKRRHEFGHGCLEGVAAAESGNNGVTGSTLIPLLTLGIPGDAVTAVLFGAFLVHGLTPGPLLFVRSADIIFAIFAGIALCNIVMLIVGGIGVRFFCKVPSINPAFLHPTILALCVVGAYAVNSSLFDVFVMLGFGFLGYLLQKLRFPLPPLLIGFILGPLAESNLRRGLMMTDGSISAFLFRPLTLIILGITLASAIFVGIRGLREAT